MTDRQKQFEQDLLAFPDPVQPLVGIILQQAGKLSFAQCEAILEQLGISLDELMVRLLPLAKHYARVPISDFRVGAVVKATAQIGKDEFDLYLGANIEFVNQPLNQSVHAEQAATMNAWHQRAAGLDTIAVSAFPCGHCRQFLYEFESRKTIRILTPGEEEHVHSHLLTQLLPEAFGPHDLNISRGLMSSPDLQEDLRLVHASKDALVLEALTAARSSYVPYSGNAAGCAIQVDSGKIYAGRYVENAAFDPSLSPIHTAFIRMRMDIPFENRNIERVVLVERPTGISQRGIIALILKSVAPDVSLEYHTIE